MIRYRSRLLVRPAALVAVACAGCGGDSPSHPPTAQGGSAAFHPEATATHLIVDTIATGLEVPWDVDFAPDGRIFLTERPGRVRVVVDGQLRPEPWAELEVFGTHPDLRPESGLMGIALAPDFEETGHVYLMATVSTIPANRILRALDRMARRFRAMTSDAPDTRWHSRVYRMTDRDGFGAERRVIIDGLPASYYHAGGGLAFGPDGKLYLTTGDVLDPGKAQEPRSLVGALLRYEADGSVPPDNPVPGSPVVAHGLRNAQGLAWHPRTDQLFVTEHGPSFLPHEDGRHGKDEINVIVPGGNYGWPVLAGDGDGGGRFVPPLLVWTPAIAPPALTFYDGCMLPWNGDLLVTGLRGQQLRRLRLSQDSTHATGWRVAEEEVLLEGVYGRLRRVVMGPDGDVYLTTSNRDGRGRAREGDDLLLRLRGLGTGGAGTTSECPS
jgi:aldose sugar dehydrogenase